MSKQMWAVGAITVAVLSVSTPFVMAMATAPVVVAAPKAAPVKAVPKTTKPAPVYVDVTAQQVKRGDTLNAIARRHGITLRQIAKLNPQIKNLNLIYPHQRIRVR
jgi:LysM repeat protein